MTEVLVPYGASSARLDLPAGASFELVGPDAWPAVAPAALAGVVEQVLASPPAAAAFATAAWGSGAATIVLSPGLPPAWAAVVVGCVAARLAVSGVPTASTRIRIAREPDGAPGPAHLEAHLREALPCVPVHRVGAPQDPVPAPGMTVFVGYVLPHPIAGWTGGSDLRSPGMLSDEDTRAALRSTVDVRVGPDGAPRSLRGSMAGAGFGTPSRTAPTSASEVALVLGTGRRGAPVAVAGDLSVAHGAVVRAVEPTHLHATPAAADVVVLGGGAPFDRDVPTASHALDLALRCARPGTIVVWLAQAAEGAGPPAFLRWFEAGRLERHLAALRRDFQPEGLVAYVLRATAARVPLYVVSREGVDLLRPMGLTPFADAQAAFDRAWAGRPSGRVVIVPCPAAVSFG